MTASSETNDWAMKNEDKPRLGGVAWISIHILTHYLYLGMTMARVEPTWSFNPRLRLGLVMKNEDKPRLCGVTWISIHILTHFLYLRMAIGRVEPIWPFNPGARLPSPRATHELVISFNLL